MLSRDEIEAMIPHKGSMCLLDSVESWSAHEIVCIASSHRDADNPLRLGDRLNALHLIEYSAQAAAVHGGLLERAGQGAAVSGLLANVRDLVLDLARIDRLTAPLRVRAQLLLANRQGCMYAFEVSADRQRLAQGRLSVMSTEAPGD